MNGVGQQQTRHQGPGTPGSQMSMFVQQNFPASHDNYGQMNHPRLNGRPAYMLPQGASSGPAPRFGPPPNMPMVRNNGMPYPGTPQSMPPAVLQQNHPNMQQTPGQGEMSVASLYQGTQPEGAQMEFNTTPVIYPSMNSQPHIFQSDVNGVYGRQLVMLRYPFMPQVQLFQTRPMPVQAVAGNPVQNPMQPYPTQVVMNQQILQQQPQASDMRQDASTPQPHHVTQFIPSMGFTSDNASFYYSPHANIAQPPSLMSGQQPMSFSPYLPHGPSQVNQSPIQTPLSQAPSKHGINKPYIMYREEYSRSLQQGLQPSSNSGTLNRKEKKTIKIVNPTTNEEVDLSTLTKSDVAGTFQKQVKEAADVSGSQTMLIQAAPKMTDDGFLAERQLEPSAEHDFPVGFYPEERSPLAEPVVGRGHESSVDVYDARNRAEIEISQNPLLQETFSIPPFHSEARSAPGVHAPVTQNIGVEGKLEFMNVQSIVPHEGVEDLNISATTCAEMEPIVPQEVAEEINDDDDSDKEDDDNKDHDGGRKHKKAGKKRESIVKNDSASSLKAHGTSNPSAGEQKENERSLTPDESVVIEGPSVEESSEAGEATEEEETEVKETRAASRVDEESVGSNPCSDLEEVKQSISRSENDITAPADDLVLTQLPPTNGLHRGRRVYSREFLMNLRDCPEALKKLPTISSDLADIIKPMASFKRESSVGALSAMGMRAAQPMNFSDFSLYGRSSSQHNRLPKKASQKRDYQQPSQQRIINLALNYEVQLHTSDQAWKPSVKTAEALGGDEAVTQKLYKKTRSILNKLTPQNFETLLKQIKELPINTEDRLAGCMDLVFEKAISEPNFCVAYAQMALNISSMKVLSKESPTEFVSFRKLLLNRCQTEFEKDKIDELELEKRQKEIDECESDEKKKVLMLEKVDTLRRLRRRSLGNIRFIGELFKMKMLTEKIMFDCLSRLMKTDDEDSIECLCWLVRTIGKDLDQPKNKKALDSLFIEISKKSVGKAMSLRTRFMLQDIIELRENNWVPRRVDINPKTIEQIHKEAQQEELQKQAMINQSPQLVNSYPPPIQSQKGNSDMTSQRGNRYHGGPRGSHQMNEEGWTTFLTKNVGRGGVNQPLDHSKLRLSKQNMDASDIKLGPCRPTTWSQGAGSGSSSGGSQLQSGSRHSSQESEKSSTSNRFAVIGNIGESYDYGRQNRQVFKEPSTAPRSQFHRMQAEGGYASLPLHSRTKQGDHSSRPNSGSRNASRESSISREASNRASPVLVFGGTPVAPIKQPPPTVVPSLIPPAMKDNPFFNKDLFKRKTECLVDEYFTILDDKEALLSAQELKMTGPMLSNFVSTVINHVIEKSPKELKLTGHLLSNLISNLAMDSKYFTKGLEEALSDAPDLEIDIPKIWDCYTELLASMLLKSPGFLPSISRAILCLKSAGKAGSLMARCMSRVAETQGCPKTVSVWTASRIVWSDFTDANLFEFVMENKLEPLSAISCDLINMMNSQADCDAIFSWIDQRIVPHEQKATFIRSLITAACMASFQVNEGGSYEIKESLFKRYTSLLNRYIDHVPDREAQTLFAIQSLVHSLDHPPNMLNKFFHLVYDIELISEDAFHEWKNSNDPNEQNGKGVATTATRAFFQWLLESVEEEDAS